MILENYDFEYFLVTSYSLPKRKTRIYSLHNRKSDDHLGDVKWNGPWRQFCFYPCGETIWSGGCLDDIRSLIGNLMRERTVLNEQEKV